MCNTILAFNRDKPAISRSGLIYFLEAAVCTANNKEIRCSNQNTYHLHRDINIQVCLGVHVKTII